MSNRGRRFLAPGLLLASACAQSAPSIPTFRANTRLVQINVIVDGKTGPVTGLTAADFTVKDNGRAQEIRVFSAEGAASRPASASPGVPAAPAPAPAAAPRAFTNAHERAPAMVVVLFDALNTPDGTEFISGQPTWQANHSFAWAKQRAYDFLRTVGPDQRVALYGLDRKLTVLADFTSDRARLLDALRHYQPTVASADSGGGAPTDVPGDFDALNRGASGSYGRLLAALASQTTLLALRAIAGHVADVPGRVSLVWITEFPPLSGAVVEAALGGNRIAVYTVDARGLLARSSVEAVNDNPDQGLSVQGAFARLMSQPSGQDQLLDIANETGGRAFVNTNDIAGAISRAASDSSESYTLGFYVQGKTLDNRFHSLRISVHGKGLHVLYPHGYWALEHPAPPVSALVAALVSPLDAAAIPLQARLSRAAPGAVELSATLQIAKLRLADTSGDRTGAVRLVTVTQSTAGAILQSSSVVLRLRLDAKHYAEALRTGLRFQQQVELSTGAATLRLVALDANSPAVGSVIVPLDQIH